MSCSAENAAIAEFIRTRGATRCPTACLAPTQASPTTKDRRALSRHEEQRAEVRRERQRRIAAAWQERLGAPTESVQ
jgi:7-keto-8-aminopelargonate synthetase-like enzyme